MNRRMGQLVVALVLFACAVILSYFSIEEKGGKTQSADIMLVLDVSNSMGDTGTTGEAKIEEAKSAALEFLGTIDPSFRIGLVTFSDFKIKLWPICPAPVPRLGNNLTSLY